MHDFKDGKSSQEKDCCTTLYTGICTPLVLLGLPRQKRRLLELMLKAKDVTDEENRATASKECVFKFLHNPVEFVGDSKGCVTHVKMAVTSSEVGF